eukprot:CAMPEP_0206458172 /NCGR_PEP_ID=MMETSP0324_2-20121206/23402_1 /ASSEMBLY_ACC=CAM_ASM_000836 /TAXON_ID=2866 /ORGANISM="Crypthecodinium cohnii, Strain Seligo" /LENGTH=420 /DNA_ID=CAMNT_0053929441 /DNA_START=68 /DNA_END=1330 /DNA_ORIENTATION=-
MGSTQEPSLVTINFKARPGTTTTTKECSESLEGTVQVDRSLLTSEFFEAKLQRWSQHGSEQHFTLELPSECNAAEGARLFKLRLEAAEPTAWSELDWWNVTSTDRVTSLTALVEIFHHTLMDNFAEEALWAFHLYKLPASQTMVDVALALELNLDLRQPCTISDPINDPAMLKTLLEGAAHNNNMDAFKKLAERCLASVDPSCEVMSDLVNAYFSFFYMPETPPPSHPIGQEEVVPAFGKVAISKFWEVKAWFENQLADVVRQYPWAIDSVDKAVRTRLDWMVAFTEGQRFKADTKWAEDLLAACFNALFVESGQSSGKATDIIRAFNEYGGSIFRDSTAYQKNTRHFVAKVDPQIFAVGTPELQRFCLSGDSTQFYTQNLYNQAHLVHEEVRAAMVKNHFQVLSKKDLDFLSKANFPGP